MDFLEVIATQKMELGAVAPVNETEIEKAAVAVLTNSDIPVGMPLTNRLDKLTTGQAEWAVCNGTAWLAYLKANGGEVVEYPRAKDIKVSPAEVHKAICQTLENVWCVLTNNGDRSALESTQQIAEWVDTLQWALAVIPNGYERQREVIQLELDKYHSTL